MALPTRRRGEDLPSGIAGFREEMNRLFEDFFGGSRLPSFFGGEGFHPVMDVVETPEEIQVKADLPGIDARNLDISISGDHLTIRGERKSEQEEKNRNLHLVERTCGTFSRSVALPAHADRDRVTADYKDGVLTVHVGKKATADAKTVKVKVK